MKQYEVLLTIPKPYVDSVVLALFYSGVAVYEPDSNTATVAFTTTDDEVTEIKK